MKRPNGHNGMPGGYTLYKGRMAMMGYPEGILCKKDEKNRKEAPN